jgi:hypothetical protein
MIKPIIMLGLAFSLGATGTALGRDSSRLVCSGIAEIDYGVPPEKIAISIDFLDRRAVGGVNREYVLSSIYQGRLFQGKIISTSDVWGGKIVLSNSRNKLFVGTFKLERQDDAYAMSLDGKINKDPSGRSTLIVAKAKLPCVDLSL